MYERQSRLDDSTRSWLIREFVAGTTGRAAAELVRIHRNTAASFYTRLRKVIAEETEKEMERASPVGGEIELQVVGFRNFNKYKYERDWDAVSEVLVFSLLKRGGKVYTEVMPNIRPATLMSIMERVILPGSVVYTDDSPKYDALNVSDFMHVRQSNDPHGIHNFWDQTNFFLERFHGIPKQSFPLFLKECEWRFNGGDDRELGNQLEAWVRLRH